MRRYVAHATPAATRAGVRYARRRAMRVGSGAMQQYAQCAVRRRDVAMPFVVTVPYVMRGGTQRRHGACVVLPMLVHAARLSITSCRPVAFICCRSCFATDVAAHARGASHAACTRKHKRQRCCVNQPLRA